MLWPSDLLRQDTMGRLQDLLRCLMALVSRDTVAYSDGKKSSPPPTRATDQTKRRERPRAVAAWPEWRNKPAEPLPEPRRALANANLCRWEEGECEGEGEEGGEGVRVGPCHVVWPVSGLGTYVTNNYLTMCEWVLTYLTECGASALRSAECGRAGILTVLYNTGCES